MNGDRAACPDCGKKVDLVYDWRSRKIKCEIAPGEHARLSWFEPEQYDFQPIVRHQCEPPPEPTPYDGRDVRPALKPKPKPARAKEPDLFNFQSKGA